LRENVKRQDPFAMELSDGIYRVRAALW